MEPIQIALVVVFIIFLVLAFIAIKVPRGRHEWGKDKVETASLVATGLTFLLLFLLLWYLSATIDWPDATAMLFWGSLIFAAALVVTALVAPDGFKLDFSKEKGKE